MTPPKAENVRTLFANRIVESGEVDPRHIEGNPLNWRTHPKEQREAMEQVLEAVGFVAPVVINRRTGKLLDGHMRAALAAEKGLATIPFVAVDLTEAEEAIALATLDPVGDLAGANRDVLRALVGKIDVKPFTGALGDLFGSLVGDDGEEVTFTRRPKAPDVELEITIPLTIRKWTPSDFTQLVGRAVPVRFTRTEGEAEEGEAEIVRDTHDGSDIIALVVVVPYPLKAEPRRRRKAASE